MVKPLYQKEREVLNFHLSLQYELLTKEVNVMKEYLKTVLIKFESAKITMGVYRQKHRCGTGGC